MRNARVDELLSACSDKLLGEQSDEFIREEMEKSILLPSNGDIDGIKHNFAAVEWRINKTTVFGLRNFFNRESKIMPKIPGRLMCVEGRESLETRLLSHTSLEDKQLPLPN